MATSKPNMNAQRMFNNALRAVTVLLAVKREARASQGEKRAVKREERAEEAHAIKRKKWFGREVG